MNLAGVNDLIDSCIQHQIKVLFVTPPAYSSYIEHLDSLQLKRMYLELRNVVNTNEAQYVDMLRDTSFVEDDFFDTDHLNGQGADKLTRKLNELIE